MAEVIRWLRWTFGCRRGRECACLDVRESGNLPPGAGVILGWTCGGCGTTYQRSVIVGQDGMFTMSDPERVKGVNRQGYGVVIGPGETAELGGP